MADALAALGPWAWLVLGLVLIGLETLAPGVFLVWLGLAALGTGILAWLFAMPWQSELILFGVLSLAAVGAGRYLTGPRERTADDNPLLNRRGEALTGRIFVLDRPIFGGEGRVRIDDTVWRVTGPEMVAGASVRVLRVDGATLVVEAVRRAEAKA